MENKKPKHTVRAGQTKVSVWENENKNGEGVNYSAKIVKSYRDGEEWKETDNYFVKDLQDLKLAIESTLQLLRVKQD